MWTGPCALQSLGLELPEQFMETMPDSSRPTLQLIQDTSLLEMGLTGTSLNQQTLYKLVGTSLTDRDSGNDSWFYKNSN